MKKLFLLVLPLLFIACHDESPTMSRLKAIERYADSDPYRVFEALDSMAASKLASAEDSALYNLLYQEALNRVGLCTQNDSDILMSERYYDIHHDYKRHARAVLSRGITLLTRHDLTYAIVCLKQAERLISNIHDSNLQFLVHSALAQANDEACCYKLALKHYNKALSFTDSLKERDRYAETILGVAQSHLHKGETDSFMTYIQRYMPLLSMQDTKAQVLNSLAEYYYQKGDKRLAKHYAKMVGETGMLYFAERIMGDMQVDEGHPDRAIPYYYQAIEAKDFETRIHAYNRLVEYFKKAGDSENALRYSWRLNHEYDMRKKVETAKLAVYQSDLDMQWQEEQSASNKRIVGAILTAILVIGVVAGTVLRRRNKRLRRQLESLNKQYYSNLRQYHKLTQQVKEMQGQGYVNSALLMQKEQEIADLQQKIAEYQDDKADPKAWNADADMLNSTLVFRLHALAAKCAKVEPALWMELNELFDTCQPSFLPSINARNKLTQREQAVCELVRLRFIPSEIAALTVSTPQAVTNLRTHLLRKIFGENGGAKTFDERIRNLQINKSVLAGKTLHFT